jgi:hypothetical protein
MVPRSRNNNCAQRHSWRVQWKHLWAWGGFCCRRHAASSRKRREKKKGCLLRELNQLRHDPQLPHDPQSWFAPHLLQLISEYGVLLNKYNCKEQERYIGQDQPLPPSEILLLPSLQSLFKTHVRNQKLSQPGDSRLVMPPSQHALSKQMMKKWELWEENKEKATNTRMLQ